MIHSFGELGALHARVRSHGQRVAAALMKGGGSHAVIGRPVMRLHDGRTREAARNAGPIGAPTVVAGTVSKRPCSQRIAAAG